MSDHTSPATTLVQLDAARAEVDARWHRHVEVLRILEARPEPHQRRIRGPHDPFTAAQELGHHAHWIEYALGHLRSRREGTPRPPRITDENATNDAWAEQDAALTFQAALHRCTAARTAYLEYVTSYVRQLAATPSASTSAGDTHQLPDKLIEGLHDLFVPHFDDHFSYIVSGLVAAEDEAWQRLTATLDSPTQDARLLHMGHDGTPWRNVDVYAHVARWYSDAITRGTAYLETGTFPDLEDTGERLNAYRMEHDRPLTYPEARRRAHDTRAWFTSWLASIPASRWTAPLYRLAHDSAARHYEDHLTYIAAPTSPE